jgi:peptidyl-dipeptidase Dcp
MIHLIQRYKIIDTTFADLHKNSNFVKKNSNHKTLTVKNILRFFILAWLFIIAISSCKNETKVDISNPFFSSYNTPFNVPPFEKIMAKHYMPAFEKGMADCRKEIETLLKNNKDPDFENTILALDKSGDLLTRVSAVFFAQSQANTNDSLQKIEVEISPKLSAFHDEIRLNPELFKKIKSVYENQKKLNLTDEQKYLLENLYKGFVRNGANLNKKDQDTLKVLNQRLSVLVVKFGQNVLSETNKYKLLITKKEELKGLPETVISAAADEAKSSGFEGKWTFTTKKPSMLPFLTYAENRDLRKELYNAYCMRGNNGNEFDNNKVLAEIVKLRAERAKLLGYRNHSAIVLEPRMAKTPENVFKLLNSLWEKAIPVAKKEKDEMQKIIDKEGGKFKLEPFDWWYYAEKLRKQKYNLDDSELRPYFKLDNVREGAFAVANKLYGITFVPIKDLPLPHPEAQGFEVKEADGSHLGILYMDFHPRVSKQQGAWCGTYANRHFVDGKTIDPVVTVVGNFTRPTGDLPALLSMEEVATLFHEFGHALDNLFNKNSFNSEFFQTFTAQDFVELPSQFMEHWAIESSVLNMYARNYKTNEPIPASLIQKIKNSGLFNQGFETVEYLAASLLDMSYHTLEAPANIDVQKFETEYLNKIGLIPEIISRYRSTYFIHITTDGYDSGYYGYIWAAVLDNDAFEAFKEKDLFNPATASSFRKNILEKNGTMDPMQMFINFRGREPIIEPLLKDRGLN